MLRRFLSLATLALLLGATTVLAQETTGAINGTVKDTTGASVAGASVTITDQDKKIVVRTVTTGDEGEYSVPSLPVGVYTVTVEAPNFKKSAQTNVKLDLNQRRTLDVALEAGNISEVVTVEADPLTVELTTPTSSTLISGDQVRELSINNRNWVQLATLAPGVSNDLADQVYVGTTNPAGQANTINISVNGARSSQNTFTVDGADITDRGSNITIQAYPSVDSIGEFKVQRSLFPAESGSSGGGQVNIVTRSGGEKFHGSLFEFVRNERLNANDFLTNASPAPAFGRDSNGKAKRSPFRYNNYGFTVGGPIYIPNFGEGSGGMFKRLAKTFFFFSEEQRRDIRYPTFTSTVPDAALRQGIFPIPVCINRNDVAGSTCTGANILPAGTPIPASLLSPAAVSYVQQIYSRLPLPTNAASYELISAFINKADFRQEIIKIDHTFTNKLSGSYRFENDKIPTLDANSLFSSGSGLPGVATTETNSPGRAHTFQTTYAVTPNTIIEGRFTSAYGAILSQNVGTLSTAASTIPIALPFVNTRDRNSTITGNGFTALQGFGPYDNFSTKKNVGGTLSTIHGTHTMKFGGSYSRYRKNENALVTDTAGPNQGTFSGFGNALPAGSVTTGTQGAINQNLARWANFLLGNVPTFKQAKFDYTADMRQSNVEAFAQDEWRMKRNMTLYYGLRFSRYGQPTDKNGRLTNFVPELYNVANAPLVTGAGNLVVGSSNICNGIIINSQNAVSTAACRTTASPYGTEISTTPKNWAPRIGFAWDPFKKGTTSIRTGYGIYHEQILVGYDETIIGTNQPFQENCDLSNVRLDNPAGTGCSSTVPSAALTIRGRQADWHTPYMQHWSLDWQQQLTRKTLFTVGYYGSKGTHLIGLVEINDLPRGLALNSFCAPGNNNPTTAGVTLVRCQPAGYAFRASSDAQLTLNPNVVGATRFQDDRILDQLRPYRGYRSITMMQPRFDSNYHGLQLSAQHRFTASSQASLAYTWSKNLTNMQNDRTNAPQDSFDIDSEWSRATLDRRHILSINYNYELPFFSNRHDLAGRTLGGWQVSGIITANSGLPFSVTTSSFDAAGLANNPAAIAGNRPNVICDPNANAPHTREQWFNIACFQFNPALNANTGLSNTTGNAQRGIVEGPPTYRVDFTMTKNVRFTENTRLQLRGEAFNVFNHTNFRGFSSTNVTGGANFGRIGTVRDPRTIQLGVKFYF